MIGEKLANRYEILSELGRGGMGVVYRARDPELNRDVAIKLIAPALLTPDTEQRFKAEAQVVARLDHPSIVSIHDFGQHEGSLFFVMPVVEGSSLRQLLKEDPLVLGEILEVGAGVAEVLDYSHAHGVIHRDIKPENIMVSRQEGSGLRVRVMDFGLARASEVTGITKTGVLVGTMAYVSPEQASGREVDTRADLYSLGTVLYECVTGEIPFSGDAQALLYRVVHEIPQSPRERGAGIDEELDRIIMWCLAKEPVDRPQSPRELVQALRGYVASLHESVRNKSVMVARAPLAPRTALPPFVGRKEESRELQQRLNAAVSGECQLVMVSGEAGVGKTRLLDELEKIARARQIRVLHGRFMEQDGSFPYHGFCEAIQEYFRQREAGSTSSAQPDFSDMGAELVSLFPMLSEVEAIRSGSGVEAQPALTGESRLPENRTQVFELLARALIRLAAGKPLVLLLEDLHGAEVSIEALRYIVRRLGPTPTLIVGTCRSTEVDRRHPLTRMLEGFEGDRHFSRIDLRSFTVSEHRELLSTLTGGADVSRDLVKRLFESTEGNPYFTKELVRSLMDAGSIVRDETGTWSLHGGMEISSEALPATIQQAVEKRIARLPDELRGVLSIAAVMGKTFDFSDLEALAGNAGDLDDAVDRLVQGGLIEEERQSRGDKLTFTSGVVREVLYAELSRRRRRSLHRKYAGILEERHGGRLERVYPQLVHHCSEGDIPDKTVEFGLKHARRSLEAFSPEEAIRSVKIALEFLDEDWEGERTLRGEAKMLLASALQASGDVDGALREMAGALRVYEREKQVDRSIDVLLAAARTAWQLRRAEEARDWVERGMGAARSAGSREKLGPFLSLAATLANLRGEYEKATRYLEEAGSLGPEAREEEVTEEIPEGGTLVAALASAVRATEPATMQTVEEWEAYSNVFEPLLTTGEGGDLVPLLCERWEIRDQGRSFVFPIRSGTRFQDGCPVTAPAVKAAFERSIRRSATDPPPAFVPIQGVSEFLEGRAGGVAGIAATSDDRLEIRLGDPLPIYPALLADARTAVYHVEERSGDEALVGTGPFRLAARSEGLMRLERNAGYWKGSPPKLEALEFRHGLSASAIAAGLESGEIDVAGDLLPQDLDRLLGAPRFRRGLAETSKMTTYFILFSGRSGAIAGSEDVRRALSGVVRAHDLVWKTLGRFAQPAVGLIPPGMLAHDPGRRRRPMTTDEARSLLRSAGAPESMTLRAAVHPVIQDRYGSLLEALFAVWEELGVTVSIETADIASFIEAMARGDELDMGLMRWMADYNDPDNFTHNLFHSATGQFRSYYSSPEADEILEAARREIDPGAREALYRKFEQIILGSGSLIPLFHDVEYRLAGPVVRGLRVRSTYPVANYADLGKSESAPAVEETRAQTGGIIQVPMTAALSHLDPALTTVVEENEVLPSIYETLTRVREGRIEPLLAADFRIEEGGRKYRFGLREDVRFHDGRRLTARDVRYSFERLLQAKGFRRAQYATIRGARAILAGRASELAGFQIHSAREFSIQLADPVAFFPVLLSDTVASIVPEGTGPQIGGSMDEGAIGTGPFRVVRFEPGRSLELERNPLYWRGGCPRSQKLVFHFNVEPAEILSGFRSGRFSVASDLSASDVAALRRDPAVAAGYIEAPSLSTYFVLFNRHRGPLAERSLRQRLAAAIDVAALVRQTLGRRAIPAHGFIPPGLLGHETTPAGGSNAAPPPPEDQPTTGGELRAGVHPIFVGEYAAFYKGLEAGFRSAGVTVRSATRNISEYVEAWRKGNLDLMVGRWMADYPDADTFVHFLSTQGETSGPYIGSPDLDELIQKGRTEVDPDARHAIYRRIEEILRRQALMLPLFHEQVYRFARPEVQGLSVSYTSPTVAYENLSVRQG